MSLFSGNSRAVLGLNSRNIDYISRFNDRSKYPLVDNKLQTKKILIKAGLPVTRLLASFEYFWELAQMPDVLSEQSEFVVKPARGFAGGGILLLTKKSKNLWVTASNKLFKGSDLIRHGGEILYGVYSIDNMTDQVIIESTVIQHEFFQNIHSGGISDIRLILFNHKPVMGMCRIPTAKSDGKANLTLGAVGVGIDMQTGVMTGSVTKHGIQNLHPDSGVELAGKIIPHWKEILNIASSVQSHFPLGFLGLDMVLDKKAGPLILELNARPGLEIQNANGEGLKGLLEKSEELNKPQTDRAGRNK